ncbi:AraC family transcriptional regulator [Prescottella agglutinans]|uniref:AraC family transcriptional regulator n=1 Tax=Prescottella agglutinans TaxID=1644129 RepID=UPI003D98AC97
MFAVLLFRYGTFRTVSDCSVIPSPGAFGLIDRRDTRIRFERGHVDPPDHSVERIGDQVGFGSPTAFRDRFKKTTGVSPQTYRPAFA